MALAEQNWGLKGEDIPCLALETKPGDIVLFHHNTKHASFKGGKARRMFTINSSQRIPEANIKTLKDYIGSHARFWIETSYGPAMTAGGGAQRRVHLEQVLANESHLPELTAKARREMVEPSRG